MRAGHSLKILSSHTGRPRAFEALLAMAELGNGDHYGRSASPDGLAQLSVHWRGLF